VIIRSFTDNHPTRLLLEQNAQAKPYPPLRVSNPNLHDPPFMLLTISNPTTPEIILYCI
jgi:hypothetical protein